MQHSPLHMADPAHAANTLRHVPAPRGPAAGLLRNSTHTLSEQLAQMLSERIRQRLLAAGTRLSSVRACAQQHGVSPSTVVQAYDHLQALGLVEARAQRGYFVRGAGMAPAGANARAPVGVGTAAGAASPHARSSTGEGTTSATPEPTAAAMLPAPVDATALVRGMFRGRGGTHAASPGLGTLPEAWLDATMLQRALRRVSQGEAGAKQWLGYGDPAGDPRLRAALVPCLAEWGVPAGAHQIVTAAGATHALDLVARTLLKPGDAVLVDEPGWAVEYARLSHLGMRLLPVPRNADGPDLQVMAHLAAAHRPRLYVTVSVLHNPTGAYLSPASAHQVLMLAAAHDFLIVEDDTYAWLAPPHAVRLAQLDGLQRTLLVGGFSKVLVPQWRVGFVAAHADVAERLVDTKLLSALTTPALFEQAVALCLEQGWLRRHAERVRQRLNAARARTVALGQQAGCTWVTPPQGLFGWLDVGTDTDRLAHALLNEGWFTAPGSLFHAPTRPTTLIRVNFASAQDARFWRCLERLRASI